MSTSKTKKTKAKKSNLEPNKIFFNILRMIDHNHTEMKKIKNGYRTLLPYKTLGYEVVYDIKDNILLTKKRIKNFLGGDIYEYDEQCKRYKVEIDKETEKVFLHKLS